MSFYSLHLPASPVHKAIHMAPTSAAEKASSLPPPPSSASLTEHASIFYHRIIQKNVSFVHCYYGDIFIRL